MKTVVICGSTKYKHDINNFCKQLTNLGAVVFEPNFTYYNEKVLEIDKYSSKAKKAIFKGLTLEHFDWIRKADVCFIYNKNDYVGISVSMEMGFASALGKPIYALSDKTGDLCRDALIDKVVKTSKELIRLLK